MKLFPKLELLVVIFSVGYVAFFPISNGEIDRFIVKSNVVIPFLLMWVSLTILSLGASGLVRIVLGVKFLFSGNLNSYAGHEAVKTCISISYVSSVLWILYALIVSPFNAPADYWFKLLSASAASLLYGFLISEMILRPMKHKAEYLQSITRN